MQLHGQVLAEAVAGIDYAVAVFSEHDEDSPDMGGEHLFCPRVVIDADGNCIEIPQRWNSLSEDVLRWANSDKATLEDLPRWANEHNEDKSVDRFAALLIGLGVRSVAVFPVREGQRIVASVALGAKGSSSSLADAHALRRQADRIEGAARTILALLRNRREDFIREMRAEFRSDVTPQRLAATLVRRLSEELDWDFVAIWRVSRRFILVSSFDSTKEQLFTIENYEQELSDGMLHETLRHGGPLLADDVTVDPPPYRYQRIPGLPARSTLMYPIAVDDKVEWILECASTEFSAFKGADIKVLDRLIDRLQSLLELWFEHCLSDAIFNGIDDSVLVVDGLNVIERANQAAVALLGSSILGKEISTVLSDQSVHEIVPLRPRRNVKVHLNSALRGTQTKLATIHLSDDLFGRWILQLSDPDDQQILAGVQYARVTVEELTAKARTPLMLARALVGASIQRIQAGTNADNIVEQLIRAVESLEKVDLSYEKIAGAIDNREKSDIAAALESVRAGLAPALADRLDALVPSVTAGIRSGLGSASQALSRVVSWISEADPEGSVTVSARVQDDVVEVRVESDDVDLGSILKSQEDPFSLVDRTARESVGDAPWEGLVAAAASEGWSVIEQEAGISIAIPRTASVLDEKG